jgi:hypothetical protein
MGNEVCRSHSGREKISYRSHAAAEKMARQSHAGIHIRTYQCQLCGSWHLTKQESRRKPAPVLSAAKVRRKLMANQANIDAQMRRLREADEQLQREQERAKKIAADAELDHAETVAALNLMVDRCLAGRTVRKVNHDARP